MLKVVVTQEEVLVQILSYSTDKDKLEMELRKLLLIRVIEGGEAFDLETEKSLINSLGSFFGKSFCHKFTLILNELQAAPTSKNALSTTVLPSAVWVNEL